MPVQTPIGGAPSPSSSPASEKGTGSIGVVPGSGVQKGACQPIPPDAGAQERPKEGGRDELIVTAAGGRTEAGQVVAVAAAARRGGPEEFAGGSSSGGDDGVRKKGPASPWIAGGSARSAVKEMQAGFTVLPAGGVHLRLRKWAEEEG